MRIKIYSPQLQDYLTAQLSLRKIEYTIDHDDIVLNNKKDLNLAKAVLKKIYKETFGRARQI